MRNLLVSSYFKFRQLFKSNIFYRKYSTSFHKPLRFLSKVRKIIIFKVFTALESLFIDIKWQVQGTKPIFSIGHETDQTKPRNEKRLIQYFCTVLQYIALKGKFLRYFLPKALLLNTTLHSLNQIRNGREFAKLSVSIWYQGNAPMIILDSATWYSIHTC
jgi:hypothetical protein